MAPSPLPLPRAVLTSLIDSIAAIPLNPAQTRTYSRLTGAAAAAEEAAAAAKADQKDPSLISSNALRQVPIPYRHLIVTLHVLFPGILLPALDLLDRGLVERVILTTSSGSSNTAVFHKTEEIKQEQDHDNHDRDEEKDDEEEERDENVAGFYLVRSAQQQSSRRRRRQEQQQQAEIQTPGQTSYVVRLGAWNCTCAAFAFSAFATPSPSTATRQALRGGIDGGFARGASDNSGGDLRAVDGTLRESSVSSAATSAAVAGGNSSIDEKTHWSWGGMSSSGCGEGTEETVPICKHILACVLGERWTAALGRYIVKRRVGREEMAGIVYEV
ncbi:hypothetical protein B0H63DRAFT_469660 [Podospora didyma]|uniref:SWIM-type domain-containing protein n=1 Tax=Podospora didyma TaxID=330526 RepID=A0AAE0U1D0_9PEZI|nr:hypothetical protein B0H63DRAFT_469660 [Podospora didyma]